MRALSLCSASVLLVAVSAATAPAQPEQVQVETNRSLFEAGETIEATITNQRKQAVFLPGCEAVVLERFSGEVYRPVRGERCVTEGAAVKIEAGGTHTVQLGAASRPGGAEHFRLQVVYGWGCNEGKPLSQARCTEFATATSAQFRLGRRAD